MEIRGGHMYTGEAIVAGSCTAIETNCHIVNILRVEHCKDFLIDTSGFTWNEGVHKSVCRRGFVFVVCSQNPHLPPFCTVCNCRWNAIHADEECDCTIQLIQ